jgi:hypothetical protein
VRRREFITVLGGAAAAWPVAARAQQPERVRRVGALMSQGADDAAHRSATRRFFRDCSNLAGKSVGTFALIHAGPELLALSVCASRR